MDIFLWNHVRMITDWLDAHSTESDNRVMRVFKIAEEVGEVAQAVVGVTGQNPRKGATHTWEDVETELCDVILAGLVALQSVAGDRAPDVFRQIVVARNRRLQILLKAPE